MLDCAIKFLDFIIKLFAVIGIVFVVIGYYRIEKIDRKIKEIKKNRHGMLQSGIEGTIKPLADERERIISKIPFLK
jgi:NADH:ubiquinone oxidoreductase subunit H